MSDQMPPALPADRVFEFVSVAHTDLERVKTMLAAEPVLVNATWDWGGGDFETALGAASHMGAREIALFLLEKGARLDLFAAAMLGYLPVVRAMVEANSAVLVSSGAHGISLLDHARFGGEPAAAVVAYLLEKEKGLA